MTLRTNVSKVIKYHFSFRKRG